MRRKGGAVGRRVEGWRVGGIAIKIMRREGQRKPHAMLPCCRHRHCLNCSDVNRSTYAACIRHRRCGRTVDAQAPPPYLLPLHSKSYIRPRRPAHCPPPRPPPPSSPSVAPVAPAVPPALAPRRGHLATPASPPPDSTQTPRGVAVHLQGSPYPGRTPGPETPCESPLSCLGDCARRDASLQAPRLLHLTGNEAAAQEGVPLPWHHHLRCDRHRCCVW